ncbi:MAG TPA: hemolysin family protein [Chloroflexota bacterium]|nr:hemolysin family protein [Chloroflexota bacterium]
MPQEVAIGDVTVQIVLIIGLILLNSFFAAAEIAIVSMRRSRIRHLAEEERDPRAARVARLVEEPGRFLATIHIGTTLTGFFASAVGAVSLVVVMANWLSSLPVQAISSSAYGIAFVAVTVAISFATLVVGELAPKNLAIMRAEPIALTLSGPVNFLSRVAAPLVWVLTSTTGLVMKLVGGPDRVRISPITEEEIMAMVASGEEAGVVEPTERKLIDEVFEFGDTITEEVMVPRVDVRALSRDTTVAEARKAIVETGHTRLPVYEGSLDNIIGVIHAKDVLQELPPDAPDEQVNRAVTSIMRRAYHVPGSKRVAELLPELQRQQLHLAVVVDEYGGTAGIVTLDNLLEEIVGPIRDEYDAREEPDIQMIGEEQAVVSGGADLGDVGSALEVDLETEGVDTIGGLVYARLGRIPVEGDSVDLPDALVEVISMRGRRVWKARVTRRELPPEEEE